MNVYMNKYIGTYSNSIYPQSYVGIKKKRTVQDYLEKLPKTLLFFPYVIE